MERLPRHGQSLVEILVGIGLGAIFIIGATTLIAPSLQTNKQVIQVQVKASLGNEMANNIRSWAAGNWGSVISLPTGTVETFYLNTTSSPFSVPGMNGSSTPTSSESVSFAGASYLRYFYLSDVYRDTNGAVTSTAGGNAYDPSTKQVTVVVKIASSTVPATTYSFYLTRNSNNVANQTSWAGGSGQNSALTLVSTAYASSNNVTVTGSGTIQLATGGNTCEL